MPETLHFQMERFDDEDGVYYVITGVEEFIVTDGKTMEEAMHNLYEAVELHFEADHLPQLPRIEVVVQLTPDYA